MDSQRYASFICHLVVKINISCGSNKSKLKSISNYLALLCRDHFVAPRKSLGIVASFLKTVAELLCNGATVDDFFVSAADVLFAPLCKIAAARDDRAVRNVESFLR